MDVKQIFRGYLTQLIKGCDNVECQNEYCKSCPKFRYKFANNTEAQNEAKQLLINHTKENHLCDGVLLLHFDTQKLENDAKDFYSIISPIDFKAVVIDFDKEKVVSYMKDFDLLPYLFTPDYKFTDIQIDQLFDYISKNSENDPFSSINAILPEFVEKLTKATKLFHIKYHLNQCLIVLMYLSLFPIDDYSEMFSQVVQHITKLAENESNRNFFIGQMSKIPNLTKRILSFGQDNLNYATINGKDSQSPEMVRIAVLFTLFRKANINLPSILFSNDLFTTELLDSQSEVKKLIQKSDSFCYLHAPAVLTLPFKFDCLSFFYQLIQFTFTPQEMFRIILDRSFLNQRFFNIVVKRSNLYEDTVKVLAGSSPDLLSRHLRVVFEGEEGVDAGGISREFFYLNCNEIFSDKYGMFTKLENGKYWFSLSTIGLVEPIYFKTLGTLVFLAVYNSVILPIRFPVLLYKKLFKVPLTIDDYSEIDPDIVSSWKNLRKMKNDGEDISASELTFSITRDNLGALIEIPLCEGGETKMVTNDNLEEYIECYADWLMNKSIEKQFTAFENGFNIILSSKNSKLAGIKLMEMIFNYDELDILVSGQEIVNWGELKVNCSYVDGYTEDSQEIKWFWEIFDEMDESQKQNFFRFSTGSDRAPVGGLSSFNLSIQRINNPKSLPVAHTCMNIFALPAYASKEEMRKKVLTAIENTEGFGLI